MFSNSTNDAIITQSHNYVGGFIGRLSNCNNVMVTISDSTNNGNVTGSGGWVGGFAGTILNNTNMSTTISQFTNNGNVNVLVDLLGIFPPART